VISCPPTSSWTWILRERAAEGRRTPGCLRGFESATKVAEASWSAPALWRFGTTENAAPRPESWWTELAEFYRILFRVENSIPKRNPVPILLILSKHSSVCFRDLLSNHISWTWILGERAAEGRRTPRCLRGFESATKVAKRPGVRQPSGALEQQRVQRQGRRVRGQN